MALLLDTHALLWALTEPDRLSQRARDRIRDRGAELVVSAASAWEVATKHRIGKLPGAEVVLDAWEGHLRRLSARELAITGRHARLGGSLAWEHRDPFDRVLAAQATVEALTLVTRDAAFADLPGLTTLW